MNFATATYCLFLAAVVLVFWSCRSHRRLQHVLLLLASYYFYATWNASYLILIGFITLLQYYVGQRLGFETSPTRRKWTLFAGLAGNLGVLATFKYYNFATQSLADLAHATGLNIALPVSHLLLPLGISFYAFHTLSYTIDIYRGKMEARHNLLDFGLFVAFFPQLVAGPIIRAVDFIPQMETDSRWDESAAGESIYRILKGLFKKLVFADLIGRAFVDPVYNAPGTEHGFIVLIATYAYAIQIYNDFSGYSDIAIGSAQLMGFRFPENFNMPYLATNLQDFWHRWHISLSTWLRDYLYISLGGSRKGARRTYINLFLTMLLGGLWHGANWTFVAWGALHGGVLAIVRMVQRFLEARGKSPAPTPPPLVFIGRVATFHIVCLGWVLFRAADFHSAWTIVQSMWAPSRSIGEFVGDDHHRQLALLMLLCAFLTIFLPQSWKTVARRGFVASPVLVQALATTLALTFFSVLHASGAAFIYFQF